MTQNVRVSFELREHEAVALEEFLRRARNTWAALPMSYLEESALGVVMTALVRGIERYRANREKQDKRWRTGYE